MGEIIKQKQDLFDQAFKVFSFYLDKKFISASLIGNLWTISEEKSSWNPSKMSLIVNLS